MPVASRYPVFVTLRLKQNLPSLRTQAVHQVLRQCFVLANEREGFRLCQYSVLNDHLHLIVEARGRRGLSSGMQGLTIRIARSLNRLWERTGKVYSDRFHDHVLVNAKEVRFALLHVLNNARRHGVRFPGSVDPFSSAAWFDGWKERGILATAKMPVDEELPTADAGTRLLSTAWRRHGLLSVTEIP